MPNSHFPGINSNDCVVSIIKLIISQFKYIKYFENQQLNNNYRKMKGRKLSPFIEKQIYIKFCKCIAIIVMTTYFLSQ